MSLLDHLIWGDGPGNSDTFPQITSPSSPSSPLDPEVARRVAADPELAAALARLEAEVISGQIGSGPILVRGKPLADYLSLDELAWWLRKVTRFSRTKEGDAHGILRDDEESGGR